MPRRLVDYRASHGGGAIALVGDDRAVEPCRPASMPVTREAYLVVMGLI
jgi:hypothetical protein